MADFKITGLNSDQRAQLHQALAISKRYIDEFVQAGQVFRAKGLLFIGPAGAGKTHLAVGILRELIDTFGVYGKFVDFTTLISDIQSTFEPGSKESKEEVLRPVVEADILVLDELGAQKPTPWVQEMLYLVMNGRYSKDKPTIFTSNYSLVPDGTDSVKNLDKGAERQPPAVGSQNDLLTDRIPARLISRLYEMAQIVQMGSVSDYRKDIKSFRGSLSFR